MDLGPTQLVVFLIIVLLVFGIGRASRVFAERARAVRAPQPAADEIADAPAPAEPPAGAGPAQPTR
jgi:Sec-independent protein translocase protein TatA